MRNSSAIFLPTAVFFVIAAVWSAGWFYVSQQAGQRLDQLIDEQASAGRTLTCQERRQGGYPFRIEVTCTAPRLTLDRAGERLTVEAGELVAIAQIYDPNKIIVELAGPITSTRTVQGLATHKVSLDSATARASVSLNDGRAARISAVLTNIAATVVEVPEAKTSKFTATRLAAHARRGEDDALDVAVQLAGFTASGAIPQALELGPNWTASAADVIARLTKAGDVRPGVFGELRFKPWLAAWRDRGGKLLLQRAAITAPGVEGALRGTATLTPNGRLAGDLEVTLADPNALFDLLIKKQTLSKDQSRLAVVALGLLGKPAPGGKGVALPVRIVDGAVYLGPVKVAQIPAVD